jgi:hypothetical protein
VEQPPHFFTGESHRSACWLLHENATNSDIGKGSLKWGERK